MDSKINFKKAKLTPIFAKGKCFTYGSTVHACVFSHFVVSSSFVTPWTVACQAPLAMEFSREEY